MINKAPDLKRSLAQHWFAEQKVHFPAWFKSAEHSSDFIGHCFNRY